MKIKRMIGSLFHILLILTSVQCSRSLNIEQKSVSPIVGIWIINEVKIKNIDFEYLHSDQMDLIGFFGAPEWKEGVGNKFEFKESGELITDFIPHEMSERIKMSYSYNDNLKVKATIVENNDSTIYHMNVDITEFTDSSMIWSFGNFMNVYLEKR